MKIIPFLGYNGNAEEAFNFYLDVFNGQNLGLMRYADMPPNDTHPQVDDAYKDKVLHATIKFGDELLYLADIFPGNEITFGNHIDLNVSCDSLAHLREIFEKLSIGANVTMEVQKTFWNAYFASLTDRFGIGWTLNYQLPES